MEREHRDRGLTLAIKAAGGQSALGRLIGRRQSTISDRLRSGLALWAEDVFTVEAATGVSRHDLRPDLYPRESAPVASVISVAEQPNSVPCDRPDILQPDNDQ
ncbi:transcriptional regulator [Sphingomonas sp. PR090111-T3T-6A]|uniref:transcriptional regulator n=1 Tax=Sphingomonas sp. PR090111-T3T-6A TaxID=685778 RepID=UPI000A039849|nr:YdaS family helix-turn-helix protein [Sphingomonas sp. PR090111-T3T-6A]